MARYNIALHNTFLNYLQHTLKMTKEEAQLAINYCKVHQNRWQAWIDDVEDIISMFVWGETEEGHDYWGHVYLRKFPPLK